MSLAEICQDAKYLILLKIAKMPDPLIVWSIILPTSNCHKKFRSAGPKCGCERQREYERSLATYLPTLQNPSIVVHFPSFVQMREHPT